MNMKIIFKVAFSFALVAVLLVGGANVSVAQLGPTQGGGNTCPANACPSNLSGYSQTGTCTTTNPHCPILVLQCDVWQKNATKCYTDCAWL